MVDLIESKTIIDEYIDYQLKYEKKYGPKAIVLMEVGSFFEVYGVENDIENVGRVSELAHLLNLVKTKKNKKIPEHNRKNPLMMGFPNHSLNKFLKILIENDNTVILIKQTTPAPNPEREVTEILSKGTYLDGLTNDVVTNNMMCVYLEQNTVYKTNIRLLSVGVSIIDLSTGENMIYETSSKKDDDSFALDEIYRLIQIHRPKELVFYKSPSVELTRSNIKRDLEIHDMLFSYYEEIPKDYDRVDFQETFLRKIFIKIGKLSVFEFLDIEFMNNARLSYILLLQYAYEHDETIISNLKKPSILRNERHLILENNCVHQLNVTPNKYQKHQKSKISSLLNILDETSTSLGRRLLHERVLNPIIDKETLKTRYKLIESFMSHEKSTDTYTYKLFEPILTYIYDIERLHRKLVLQRLQPCEFYNLHISYNSICELLSEIDKIDFTEQELSELSLDLKTIELFKKYMDYYQKIFDIEELGKYNIQTVETSIFKRGVFLEIDEIYDQIQNIHTTFKSLARKLSKYIDKTETAISVKYTDKFGYYLGLTKRRAETLKKAIHKKMFKINGYEFSAKTFEYKKNTSTCRIEQPTMEKLSDKLISLNNKLKIISNECYVNTCQTIVDNYYNIFQKLVDFVSKVDLYKSCAKITIKNKYTKPTIYDGDKLESFLDIKGLRHPIIEKIEQETSYVPNDLSLGNSTKGILLYGVNASGKSSLMKSIGLNVIMAQAGLFVAAENFYFNPYRSIFTRIGNLDNIFKSQSTFEVEMSELRNIIKRANKNSLILGDELCSGTESVSALAIVCASIINLESKSANLVFATHLHELAKMKELQECPAVVCMHLDVRYDEVSGKLYYDRKLKMGNGKTIYGLEVCKALDLPREFIEMANKIRTRYTGKSQMIIDPKKSSVYNPSVYIIDCQICGKQAVDAHHIKFQCLADHNDMIGHIHKNHKSNLVPLCKQCHIDVHKGIIDISGYIKTTEGLELEYKKYDIDKTVLSKKKYSKDDILKVMELKTMPNITQKKALLMLKGKNIKISSSTLSKMWNGKYFS